MYSHIKMMLIAGGLIGLSACLPGANYDVEGVVQGQTFVSLAGTAESQGLGNYVITLVNDSNFDCYITPTSSYLKIVAGSISEPGAVAAAGNVTFSKVEDGVEFSSSATGGEVVIDEVDIELETISGSLNVFDSESNVSGAFSVRICP